MLSLTDFVPAFFVAAFVLLILTGQVVPNRVVDDARRELDLVRRENDEIERRLHQLRYDVAAIGDPSPRPDPVEVMRFGSAEPVRRIGHVYECDDPIGPCTCPAPAESAPSTPSAPSTRRSGGIGGRGKGPR